MRIAVACVWIMVNDDSEHARRIRTFAVITIRRAVTSDIPGIRSVLAITWRNTYSELFTDRFIARVSAEWHSVKILEAEMDRSSTFLGVALRDSTEVVAVVTAHSHGELLSISRLYVLPVFQRQGIGKRLLTASYREFPEAQRVTLAVEEQNPKARDFYRKVGFREIGVNTDDVGGTMVKSVVLEKHIEKVA
jgi:ribosomal protein S18 acetylase RimI-like enzyme